MIKKFKYSEHTTYRYINIEDYIKEDYKKLGKFDYFYCDIYDIFFVKNKCLSQSNIDGSYNCCLFDNDKYEFIIPESNTDHYTCKEYSYCRGSFKEIYGEEFSEIILLLCIAKDALRENIDSDIIKIQPVTLINYLKNNGWIEEPKNILTKEINGKKEEIIISYIRDIPQMKKAILKICKINELYIRIFVTTLLLESI